MPVDDGDLESTEGKRRQDEGRRRLADNKMLRVGGARDESRVGRARVGQLGRAPCVPWF